MFDADDDADGVAGIRCGRSRAASLTLVRQVSGVGARTGPRYFVHHALSGFLLHGHLSRKRSLLLVTGLCGGIPLPL